MKKSIESATGDVLLEPGNGVDLDSFIQNIRSDILLKRLMKLGVQVYFQWQEDVYLLNGRTKRSLNREIEKNFNKMFDSTILPHLEKYLEQRRNYINKH